MTAAGFNVATCANCGQEFNPPVLGSTSDTCEECRRGRTESLPTSPDAAIPSAAAPARKLDATTVLFAINVLVFVLMVLSGVSPLEPSVEQLLKWGGDFGPATFDHQWWRLLTSTFVHAGILHLAFNMWAFWGLGKLTERLFGSWPMVALYLLSGLGASVASLWWHPLVVGIGASGAIFGIAGGLFVFLKLKKVALPRDVLRRNIGSLGMFLVYNLVIGAAAARVDNAAHVGGLVTGAVIGAMLPLQAGENGFRRYAVLPLVLAILIGGAAAAKQARIGIVEYAQAEKLLQSGKYDQALPLLQSAVQHEPGLAAAQFGLGFAYMKLKRNAEAETAFRNVLKLKPDLAGAHYNLGVIYWRQDQLDQALLELQRAAASDPKDPEAPYVLGMIFLQKNDPAHAIQWLQKALALKPDYAAAQEALNQATGKKD
jgi:rhomboid protease GluP